MKLFFIFNILYIFLFIGSLKAQIKNVQFDHITSDDGLGSNTIHAIVQDKQGFMWIGTTGGLYRYDGYELKAYLNNPQDSTSIIDNNINCLLVGSDNTLYVGTWDHGLSIFDHKTETFINYSNGSKVHSIHSNLLKCIFEDSHQNIWIGMAENGGIAKLNKKTKQFKHYKIPDDNRCMAIVEDKAGILWITNYSHFCKFNAATEKFTIIKTSNPNVNTLNAWSARMNFDDRGNLWIATCGSGLICYTPLTNAVKHWSTNDVQIGCMNVWDIIQKEPGKMWLATDGEGLVEIDLDKNIFTHYKTNINDPKALNSNAIYCLLKDQASILWVGTFNGGVNIFNPNKIKFDSFRLQIEKDLSLSNKSVLCVLEDRDKNLWIGTDGGGLNLYNFQKYGNKIIKFLPDPKRKEQTAPSVIKSMMQDSQGLIWLGTWGQGFVLFDPKTEKFNHTLAPKTQSTTGGIWQIVEDDSHNIWISELGVGLKKINPQSMSVKNYFPHSKKGLFNPVFLSMLIDSKKRLWLGSEGSGVFLYKSERDSFLNYSHNKDKVKSISGNVVRTIFQDHKGRLWFGTLGSGLNLFNEKDSSFTLINEKDGLIANTINSIEEDKQGNLWIATNKGMTCYNYDTKKVKYYGKEDGLQGSEYNYNASCKTADGLMAFGGLSGFNLFDPSKILDNMSIPPVFITSLSIFNHPVKINDATGILNKSIFETKKIVLTHLQSVFTFTFSALNYTHTQKNQYAFILENFETKWNYVGNKKEATYTNLDPGTYIFKVKACNNDGIWNEKGISMEIVILPPFWKTWWFRLLMFLFVLGSIVTFFRSRIKILKNQKLLLERKVNERTKELNKSNILLKDRQSEIIQQSEELKQQSEEMTAQRDELTVQNFKITNQNNHITASVRYAQTLQNAILPTFQSLDGNLEYFVIYKPKDIVSGDYYWYLDLTKKQTQEEEIRKRFILTVIDCTGHGVPGAFMTLIADRLMNEVVVEHEITDPADILEELDKGVQTILKQNTTTNRDGMDLVVCLFEQNPDLSVNVTFAGSKNPLYYFNKALNQIVKVESDRRYIGMMATKNKPLPFTNKSFTLQKGDVIFLATDGYIDQSNNERKRLGSHLFADYLLEFANLPIDQIKEQLEIKLLNWQEDQMQRDDISLIGIRI